MTDAATPAEDFDQMVDAVLAPDDLEPETATDEERHDWRIDGERTATWALRRLARAAAERERARALADELRAQADAYEEAIGAKLDRDEQFFTVKLRQYHDELLAENPRAKTVTLPGGKLKQAKGRISTVVEDEDVEALVAWAEDNDTEAIEYHEPTPNKRVLLAKYGAKISDEPDDYPAVDEKSGELIPGVTFRRPQPTFAVVLEDAADEEGADE